MSIDLCTPPIAPIDPDIDFVVTSSIESEHRVIHVAGELDMVSRNEFFRTCLSGDHVAIVVDMAQLAFLDCGGYGGLVAARLVLQERGKSLTVRNQTGQPARLLSLLSLSELAS